MLDGGLKLIYNESPSNGKCNNTEAVYGNSTYDTLDYNTLNIGYMYGSSYNSINMEGGTTPLIYNVLFGNSIEYEGGNYTLQVNDGEDFEIDDDDDLASRHYTCFTRDNTCSSVYYVFHWNDYYVYYITLTGGKTVEIALADRLDRNVISSTIKNVVDSFYISTFENTEFENYLEDTVWCNDRSVSSLGGWNPNGGVSTSTDETSYFGIKFSSVDRVTVSEPSLTCSRNVDSFTVSRLNGNGKLDYPIGLLTMDEDLMAGLSGYGSNNYLSTGIEYWLMTPGAELDIFLYNYTVAPTTSFGYLGSNKVDESLGVRPAISLKTGFKLASNSGDGTGNSPYVVE